MDNLTPLKSRGLTWLRKYYEGSTTPSIIYTVTTGKTFYIMAASLRVYRAAAGNTLTDLLLRDGDDTEVVRLLSIGSASLKDGDHGAKAYPIPLEVPSGWDIVCQTGTDCTVRADIIGWEE